MNLNIPGVPNLKSGGGNKDNTEPDFKEGEEPSDFLFFNIMPKAQAGAEIIDPKIVSTDTESPIKQESPYLQLFKKYKLYFIIGISLVVTSLVAYLIFTMVIKSQYKDDVLLTKPKVTPTPHPTKAAPTPTNTVDGFTTTQDWRDKYFPNCKDISICGDSADPDHDGLTNIQEYNAKTDPNNPDSDQDGISDGDELNVFGSDPLKSHTRDDKKFSDMDYVKGGFSFQTDQVLTVSELAAVKNKMAASGLHEPTITSVGDILNTLYSFSSGLPTPTVAATPSSTPTSTPSSTPISGTGGFDQSLSAKQDRDTKRSNTMKNIEEALIKYQNDNKTFPIASDFDTMYAQVKPYIKIATNPKDPINSGPYVYLYLSSPNGSDFSLTFQSEVANGPITKHAADAQKEISDQNAETYDSQRISDLEELRSALLLYSQANVAGNQQYVFPTKDKYKTALVPNYIEAVPKDPITQVDYDYEPDGTFDTFTLKSQLQLPPNGNTGYICNQIDECHYY